MILHVLANSTIVGNKSANRALSAEQCWKGLRASITNGGGGCGTRLFLGLFEILADHFSTLIR